MDRKVVLLVEDDGDELTIYTTLLTHHGYEVVAADGFDDALHLARGRQPDLAVVDVNLGEGRRDGCDLVAALRDAPETADIPVIVHTAYGDVYRRALQSTGCQDIVHKPSNPRVLLAAVRRVLGPDAGRDGAQAVEH
jgi:two-component system, sensor histidine kinase and response regulator